MYEVPHHGQERARFMASCVPSLMKYTGFQSMDQTMLDPLSVLFPQEMAICHAGRCCTPAFLVCSLYTSSLYQQFDSSRKGEGESNLESDIWKNVPSRKRQNKIKDNLFFTHLPQGFHSSTWLLYIKVTFHIILEKYLHIGCSVFKENSTNMEKLHKMCNKNIIMNSVNSCWKSNNKILLLYTPIEHFSPREIYNFSLLYQQTFWYALLLSRLKLDAWT